MREDDGGGVAGGVEVSGLDATGLKAVLVARLEEAMAGERSEGADEPDAAPRRTPPRGPSRG